jgi:hypothetical protein
MLFQDATTDHRKVQSGQKKWMIPPSSKEKLKEGVAKTQTGQRFLDDFEKKLALENLQEDITAKKYANTPVQKLHTLLEERYGNIVNGFFVISDSRLAITFEEFAKGLKKIGFSSEPSKLWQLLELGGRYGNDLLTLTQFHPKAIAIMNHFRRWMIAQFGDVKKAWAAILKKLEISGNEFTKITKYRFITAIETLEFPGDCEFVYSCLDFEDAGFVTFEEVDWMTKDPILAHREESNMRKGGGKKMRKQVSRQKNLESNVDFNQFRTMLEQKYGNLIRCWYKWSLSGGDDTTHEVMTWDDFKQHMEEEGFQEKLVPHSSTWDILNCGKHGGVVHVEEFAPATITTLFDWMKFLQSKFGSLQIAWKYIVSKVGGEPIGKYQFCSTMEAFGFEGNSPAIFGILDVDSAGRIGSDFIRKMPHQRHA